jgi:hypothetical protein
VVSYKGSEFEVQRFAFTIHLKPARLIVKSKKLVLGIMACRFEGKVTLNVEPRTLNPEVFATNIWLLR